MSKKYLVTASETVLYKAEIVADSAEDAKAMIFSGHFVFTQEDIDDTSDFIFLSAQEIPNANE